MNKKTSKLIASVFLFEDHVFNILFGRELNLAEWLYHKQMLSINYITYNLSKIEERNIKEENNEHQESI